MRRHGIIAIAVLTVVAGGCAIGPRIAISGKTTASPRLQRDVLGVLTPLFQGTTKCAKIDAVEAETISIAPDSKMNESGYAVSGFIVERWTAVGCGQRATANVRFTPDESGGAFFGVKLED